MKARLRLLPLACLLLAGVLASAAFAQRDKVRQLGDDAPEGMGSIDHLQVTGITRQAAALWIRTTLPLAADGWRQKFTGGISVANVQLPVHPPLTVAVQSRNGKFESVFDFNLKLAEMPAELLTKIGAHALDMMVEGTLTGEKGAEVPVRAVGLLRYATSDIDAPYGAVSDFVKLASARLTGVSLSETKGEARVLLYNPFGFSIPIRSITYSLISGDRKLCGGEKTPLRIHPGRENEILLPITAKNSDLIAAAGNAVLAGGTIEGRLVGAITFRIGRGDITLPIDLPGKIQLSK